MMLPTIYTPVHANDTESMMLSLQALQNIGKGDLLEHEKAFDMLYRAWEVAESQRQRDLVQRDLERADRALDAAYQAYGVPFLDVPNLDRIKIYERLAEYGSPRGQRLYAESVSTTHPDQTVQYIFKAAHGGDARACYYAARLCLYGLQGIERDGENARQWLLKSANLGYAPAWEKLAEIYWDGDGCWNADWNQELAMENLQKAIDLYKSYSLTDKDLQESLDFYIRSLEDIHRKMERFHVKGSAYIDEGFYPNFTALRLSFYNETDAGLRIRLFYIVEYLLRYPVDAHVDHMRIPNLAYTPIHLANLGTEFLGMRTHRYVNNDQIHLKLEINAEECEDPENYTGIAKEQAYWKREQQLNSTIAHEWAHAVISLNYSYNNSNRDCGKSLIEGHAISTEYYFRSSGYYDSRLSPERFADLKTTDYAQYFRWYRANCLNEQGYTNWSSFNYYAQKSGGKGRCSPTQVVGPYGVQPMSPYFNRAFMGCFFR